MGQHPPVTRRFHRPGWKDPRLAVGVFLVAVALMLGLWAVERASHTVEVYTAKTTLVPGEAISSDALVATRVPPGPLTQTYLPVNEPLQPDAVVVRVVPAGELVPRGALGDAAGLDLRPVTVPLRGGIPPGVTKGSMVDLWLTAATGPGYLAGPPAEEEPSLLAEGLIVAEVMATESIFTASGGNGAQVLVPRADLSRVLGALAGERDLVVIPVLGGQP